MCMHEKDFVEKGQMWRRKCLRKRTIKERISGQSEIKQIIIKYKTNDKESIRREK